MPWEVVILCVVGFAALALVLWPFVWGSSGAPALDPSEQARRDLDEQLGISLEAIREIEMDHRAGNLSDDDFAAFDRVERARAVELMRQGDALGGEG